MHFLGAIVVFFIGQSLDVDIKDIPFAELTLSMVCSSLLSIILYLYAVYYAWQSLCKDPLWPWKWRWNRQFWGNVLLKIALNAFVIFCAIWFMESRPLANPLFIYGVAVALSLIVFYSDAFTLFDEENAAVAVSRQIAD